LQEIPGKPCWIYYSAVETKLSVKPAPLSPRHLWVIALFALVATNVFAYQDAPTSVPVSNPPAVSPAVESRTRYFDRERDVRFVIETASDLFGVSSAMLYANYPDGTRKLLRSTTTEHWNEVIAREAGVILLAETTLYVLDADTGAEKKQIAAAPNWCLIGESFQNTTFSVWTGQYLTVYDADLNALAQNYGGGCFNTGYAGGGLTAWEVPIEFPKQTRLIHEIGLPVYLGGWKVFVRGAWSYLGSTTTHIDDYSRPTYYGEVRSGPYPNARPVVEYYNSQLQRYFLTINPEEQAFLDADPLGWGYARTSYYFWGWQRPEDAPPTANEVCRFYSPINQTHFYTFAGFECDLLDHDPVTWIDEEANRFLLVPGTKPPDFDGPYSSCPFGSVAIDRYWNGGVGGTNHRYIQRGDSAAVGSNWISEGTRFCAAS
jgi:hypothetical protein